MICHPMITGHCNVKFRVRLDECKRVLNARGRKLDLIPQPLFMEEGITGQKKKKWYYKLFALAPVCWTGQGREEDGNLDPDAGD